MPLARRALAQFQDPTAGAPTGAAERVAVCLVPEHQRPAGRVGDQSTAPVVAAVVGATTAQPDSPPGREEWQAVTQWVVGEQPDLATVRLAVTARTGHRAHSDKAGVEERPDEGPQTAVKAATVVRRAAVAGVAAVQTADSPVARAASARAARYGSILGSERRMKR